MKQLSHLIEQARNQKSLDVIFDTNIESQTFLANNKGAQSSPTLISKLDDLEVELFPCTHLSSPQIVEMINTLESVLEDI